MGSYVNSNLLNGESIVHEAQFSGKAAGFRFACAIVFAVICVISLVGGFGENVVVQLVLASTSMVLAPVFGYMSIAIILAKANFELGLTTQRLIGKVGILSVKSMDAPLDKIQNVSVSCSIIGRMLGYGSIQVNTAGGVFQFTFVDDPDSYKGKIMNQIEKYKEEKTHKDAEALAKTIMGSQAGSAAASGDSFFCPKCGAQNAADTVFCRKCGNKIN